MKSDAPRQGSDIIRGSVHDQERLTPKQDEPTSCDSATMPAPGSAWDFDLSVHWSEWTIRADQITVKALLVTVQQRCSSGR